MITRFQSTPLPLPPRPLHSKSGSVIQFGHPGGHVHTEKCKQGQCAQSKPKEGNAEERQFFLMPIIEKVKAFFENIWKWITNMLPNSQKEKATSTEKAASKTKPDCCDGKGGHNHGHKDTKRNESHHSGHVH